jgi:MoaD family protein
MDTEPKVTITVKPFHEIRQIIGRAHLNMEIEEGTGVHGLLEQLAETYAPGFQEALLDPNTGEVKSDYLILVNGKGASQLPHGMHTPLSEGDVVSIMMIIVGG